MGEISVHDAVHGGRKSLAMVQLGCPGSTTPYHARFALDPDLDRGSQHQQASPTRNSQRVAQPFA